MAVNSKKDNKPYLMMVNPIPQSHQYIKKEILKDFNDPTFNRRLEQWILEGVIHGADLDSVMERVFAEEAVIFIVQFRWKEIRHMFSLDQYKRYKEHLFYLENAHYDPDDEE